VRGRLPQFFILHQLNGHIAEGLVRQVPGDVGKVPWRKTCVAIREFHFDRRLSLNFLGDVSIPDRDVDIVVAMVVHERRGMGRDLDVECANVIVFDRKVMRGFRGDLDLSRGLCSQKGNQQEKQ